MESGGLDVESGHLGVGDLDALFIVIFIEATGNTKPGIGGGAGDQLADDQVADQCLAAPVLGDEREQPLLVAGFSSVRIRLKPAEMADYADYSAIT